MKNLFVFEGASFVRFVLSKFLDQSIRESLRPAEELDIKPRPGIFFKLARCGYTLRVTSQASYSPDGTLHQHRKIHRYKTLKLSEKN